MSRMRSPGTFSGSCSRNASVMFDPYASSVCSRGQTESSLISWSHDACVRCDMSRSLSVGQMGALFISSVCSLYTPRSSSRSRLAGSSDRNFPVNLPRWMFRVLSCGKSRRTTSTQASSQAAGRVTFSSLEQLRLSRSRAGTFSSNPRRFASTSRGQWRPGKAWGLIQRQKYLENTFSVIRISQQNAGDWMVIDMTILD